MSVVVLGMEMPECCQGCEGHLVGEWNEYDEMCDTCIFVLSEHPWEPKHKEIDGIDTSKSIPDWCPLRPLPEKHGRLGDLDELKTSFADSINECKKWIKELEENGDNETLVLANQAFCTFVEAALRLKSVPTIVEAEGD